MTDSDRYKVLIVEDEVPARDLLRRYLDDWKQFEVSGIARTGQQALDLIGKAEFDLIFLDIHLPEKSGLEVLKELGDEAPLLVFTTAYADHMSRAFEVGACDYLLKPYTKERFQSCMDRTLAQLKLRTLANHLGPEQSHQILTFREGGLLHRVLLSDLYYLTANGKKCVLHTKSGDFETSRLMGDLEKELPQSSFLRIHRKHVVNIEYVAATRSQPGGGYVIFLKDEDETNLPVGREYAEGVRTLFKSKK
ncbi:DNA-binding response regulator [Leptospira perolatii]|uniref:DNA-binding response regulator n=1 Tax=Leptospira perolatii TaxID=2023191 RepID=A0A2M9ZNE7_9LEPT|nr:LytTR family DNA-binding domain-containing protein [Leptospira perolatii]PJZ68709.1 DNA-binding response regulator [Leptospira perolatii]PJZ73545.1 DNA-binding response regulator [Leptospira perolatii]